MYSISSLKKTDMIVSCLLKHANFSFIWVKENIKIDIKGRQDFKYTILFCIDSGFNISPMYRLPEGVPFPASDSDFASGEGLYQNLAQSQYFVKLTDHCKNGIWCEPKISYYLPDKNSMQMATRGVPSTGYDRFEFGLNELNRVVASNHNLFEALDAAATRFVLAYRTRMLTIVNSRGAH